MLHVNTVAVEIPSLGPDSDIQRSYSYCNALLCTMKQGTNSKHRKKARKIPYRVSKPIPINEEIIESFPKTCCFLSGSKTFVLILIFPYLYWSLVHYRTTSILVMAL